MSNPKNFSVGKSPSPYRIEVAPGFEQDASQKLSQIFGIQKGEIEASYNQKKQLIGNLDTLSHDFSNLFTTLATIRAKIEEVKHVGKLNGKQHSYIDFLNRCVSRIESILVSKIIPTIDELGK